MRLAAAALGVALSVAAIGEQLANTAAPITWTIDNLTSIGGHAVSVIGAPAVVQTDIGPAVQFNGRTDGLLIDTNPIAGLRQFTIEVLFSVDRDGSAEQRFLHLQERDSENRALLELRLSAGRWSLDSYLRNGAAQLTLLDRERTHAAGAWHTSTTTFDGETMRHYVDGVTQGEGAVAFKPLGPGRTSIGVRQNLVSWFKGRIRSVRITPAAGKIGQSGQAWPALIFAGDHPDPSVLKDGGDYYMTHSSFDAYPGLMIWHSTDLVNWRAVAPALTTNVGSVWAPELVKHAGRYYIYFPGVGPYRSNYVVWADSIRGPWSDPIDLKIERIDPGHAVGPDGRRYLFMSGGFRVPLAADGLSVTGPAVKVYDGWKYPAGWIVESFSQEGPKMIRRGDYYYMVLAEGGTAGPPTGHMIVAARSRSIDGPWDNSPHNPIVRTTSASEPWWSKGHGTLVEGAGGQWYVVYHAYENGFYTLGRQTLIEPITWTADGWFTAGDSGGARLPAADPRFRTDPSYDFSSNRMGTQWSFYKGAAADRERVRFENGALVLKAKGAGPADSSPLGFVATDHAYEIEVEIEAGEQASAGLLLFYSSRLYAGIGYSDRNLILHRYGTDRLMAKPAHITRRLQLRLRNDRHIVTIQHSVDGTQWEPFGTAMEVSGYHHNVAGEFLSLKPAIYAAGEGEVRFWNFKYRALP